MIDTIILTWFLLGMIFLIFNTLKLKTNKSIYVGSSFLIYTLLPIYFGAEFISIFIATISFLGSFTLHRFFYKKPLINIFSILILWFPFEFEWFQIGLTTTLPVSFAMVIMAFYSIYFIFSKERSIVSLQKSFKLTFSDLKISFLGFSVLVALIVPIGTSIGFLKFSLFEPSILFFLNSLLVGYFLIALPEELLFRHLMTDLLAPFLKNKFFVLIITSLIFGLAHLNNQAVGGDLNWPYAGLATIAGLGYGWVFYKTNKVSAAAFTHMLINFTWAMFFNAPY